MISLALPEPALAYAANHANHSTHSNHSNHASDNTPNIQAIIRLDNCKSYVFNFTPNLFTEQNVLTQLSNAIGLPCHMIKLQLPTNHDHRQIFTTKDTLLNNNNNNNNHQHFLSASTFLPIRGGKGGFGTLLKGQSKQAGAKRTLDFGACRDLNGRRLRHVNDEIKLRKWRESMRKKMEKAQRGNNSNSNDAVDGGIDIEEELEELRTASGIRNWHLMVPNWSEVGGGGLSSKSRRAMERSLRIEIEKIANQTKRDLEQKRKKKAAWEDAIVSYANAAERHTKDQEKKMTDSILEGMNKRKKRKLDEGTSSSAGKAVATVTDRDDGNEELDSILAASNICTLSGDVVLEEKANSMLVQSKSEFATSALLLNSSSFEVMTNKPKGLYYEVTVKTCGIAQIGWAALSMNDGAIKGFLPNSDTGDGVGDDSFSYGFDGSRGLAFHDGKTTKYGQYESKKKENPTQWKEGDVIGCSYDVKNGKIHYSINGENLGVAFEVEQKDEDKQLLHPVLSLNQTEIVELNTGPDFQFAPRDFVGVASLVGGDKGIASQNNEKPATSEKHEDEPSMQQEALPKKVEKVVEEAEEPINLNKFDSAKELEKLGGDRLKKELFRLGCKCGGPVQERAKRLYSTKGLKRSDYPKKILHPNAKV